jgi:hypothetical protein
VGKVFVLLKKHGLVLDSVYEFAGATEYFAHSGDSTASNLLTVYAADSTIVQYYLVASDVDSTEGYTVLAGLRKSWGEPRDNSSTDSQFVVHWARPAGIFDLKYRRIGRRLSSGALSDPFTHEAGLAKVSALMLAREALSLGLTGSSVNHYVDSVQKESEAFVRDLRQHKPTR